MAEGKTMDTILAEARRRARERMGLPPESGGETMPEQETATAADSKNSSTMAEPLSAANQTAVSEAQTVPEHIFRPGEVLLDSYRITSEAIRGGMGSVWKVYHNGWHVELAMKRPQAKHFDSERSKENFIRECESWMDLGLHPNIVSCYYVREVEGVPTIFSEWMNNGSLKDHIKSGDLYAGTPELLQKRLLKIAIQFARGLRYAHERDLIHQDVKPDNLLLTGSWDAKVADFGLARACSYLTGLEGNATEREMPDPERTTIAPTGGYTFDYASPEQLNAQLLTRRTDIYSWAVSVMEMYLGEHLWFGGNAAGEGCRGFFQRCRVPMPEALQMLLAQCMEREQEARPHDLGIVLEELMRIYETVTGRQYPYPSFDVTAESADSLNNRALSMMELGRTEEAEKLFEDALAENPTNPNARYNHTLYLYRQHRISAGDAILLMQENWSSNDSPRSFALFMKLIYECEGEDRIRQAMSYYRTDDAGRYTDAKLVEEMLANGSIRADYELCRILDIKSFESCEQRYAEAKKAVGDALAAGDIKSAVSEIHIAEADEEMTDRINRREWLALTDRVRAVCFSVTDARIWTEHILPGIAAGEKLSFSEDGRRLLCGERLYETETGRLIADNGSPSRPRCSRLSADGIFYLRSCEDGYERVDAESGIVTGRYQHKGKINDLVISADQRYALSVGDEPLFGLTELESGRKRGLVLPEGNIQEALIRYDNKELLLRTKTAVYQVDLARSNAKTILHPEKYPCTSIAVDTRFENLLMALPCRDGRSRRDSGVMLYELKTGQSLVYTGHDEYSHLSAGVNGILSGATKAVFTGNGAMVSIMSDNRRFMLEPENDNTWMVNYFPSEITDCAETIDGRYTAICAGNSVYIGRRVSNFLYADYDTGIDSTSLMQFMEISKQTISEKRSTPPFMVEDALKKQLRLYFSSCRYNAHIPESIYPYAYITAARSPDRGPRELMPSFTRELERRGVGYVSAEAAETALERACTDVRRDNAG